MSAAQQQGAPQPDERVDPTEIVPLPDDPELPRLPGFLFLRRLGGGGMGAVFVAEDQALRRQVAIKFNTVRGDDRASDVARARFKREGQAMAQVDHPNLARVYGYGEHGGRQYLVMELVGGEDLGKVLRALGALPERQALDIVRQVVVGLGAAWERGVVHRDLKPGNVIVQQNGVVKVVDFGLAHSPIEDGLSLTQSGMVVGTMLYLAPERARGERGDLRSDLYALGLMLFRMVCGRDAFEGDTAAALVLAQLQKDPPDARRFAPATSGATVALIRRLTAKDPALRPASAGDALRAVGEALRSLGGDADAAPADLLGTAGPAPRRLRFWAFAAAATLAAVAVVAWLAQPGGGSGERAGRPEVRPAAVKATASVSGAAATPDADAAASDRAASGPADAAPGPAEAAPALAPLPDDLPPADLLAALRRLRTGALGLRVREVTRGEAPSAARGATAANGDARRFEVALDRAAAVVLLHVRSDGSIRLLVPAVPQAAPQLAGTSTLTAVLEPEADSVVVALGAGGALRVPRVVGAFPTESGVEYPARRDAGAATAFPSRALVAALFRQLADSGAPHDLAEVPVAAGPQEAGP